MPQQNFFTDHGSVPKLCEHKQEASYCFEDGCPFNVDNYVDCGVCGGIHTKAFYDSGYDCRADYPKHDR